ncbi:darcynin family protein [Brenneria uluponensis]|uniref:darcynin family protein n=1 Tax=Brenneria uluponensis TaxID=3057057 RepID=UPI0028EB3F72|nr:darcynin family protein [Brenneria ulupoensis]
MTFTFYPDSGIFLTSGDKNDQALMITVFVLLKTTTEWLRLPRSERNRIADEVIPTVLSGGKVSLRMFDAEAFTTKCTDVAMFHADDMESFYFAIERLRDSTLITKPYFEMIEIIPTIEDGFKKFEEKSHIGT